MAQIPITNRLIEEDFPEQKQWIRKLIGPLNTFMQAVSFALNGGLTFEQNITGQRQLLDFTYNGTSSLPVKFTWKKSGVPQALQVVSATENLKTPVALIVAWSYTEQGQISVSDIIKFSSGAASTLTTGARYQIRIEVRP